MSGKLLEISNLHVAVEEKTILQGVDLQVQKGETHVLMGPNGAGKSTLGNAIMGNPLYQVSEGQILFAGEDIVGKPVYERAKRGIFLSFQNPVEISGISLSDFLRSAVAARTGEHVKLFAFKKQLAEQMEQLSMDPSYAGRDLNVGFSGGEKKKAEILQLMMLKPEFAILDEPDSGLDVDAVHTVSKGIRLYQQQHADGAILIITHSTKILESLRVDKVHVLVDGRIAESGDASLIDEINRNGYERFQNKRA
ncbi:MAG: Fe-S cluster assembly ATPase SufC [Lachnospiraceae bacterium]|nr:Fe-S cluster assembly ATPase SufC [Lachnospiraceae bacterium]